MAGNSLGQIFRVTTAGESHGISIVAIVDGCPAGIPITEEEIQVELNRRRPGQNDLVTPRDEKDKVKIESGIYEGKTTGTPIVLRVPSEDQRSEDYSDIAAVFRPSHSDFTYNKKYGFRDPRGGGRSSARATAAIVAAGAIAAKVLKTLTNIEIHSYVLQIGKIKAPIGDLGCELSRLDITRELIELSKVRCPHKGTSDKMVELVKMTKDAKDSLGGIVETVIKNVPGGLGEPLFDKIEADLAKAMLSINATKGFEIGSGFEGTTLNGSTHNDPFVPGVPPSFETIRTSSNNAGGVLGGITTGMPIYFRTAFKPTPTIGLPQQTVNINGEAITFEAIGRHDPCVLPRAVSIVDAMSALVLCDHYLRAKSYQ